MPVTPKPESVPPPARPSKPSRASRAGRPRRPWYLLAGLVAAWAFGLNAMSDGCSTIAFYQGQHIELEPKDKPITNDVERATVLRLGAQWEQIMTEAKRRVLPLGIASFLLGGAMVILAARAMSGRSSARNGLVQVTAARAALVFIGYLATADVRAAGLELDGARFFALQAEDKTHGIQDREQYDRTWHAVVKVWPPLQLFLSTLASALVVVALTRPKARAYFEGPPQLSEP